MYESLDRLHQNMPKDLTLHLTFVSLCIYDSIYVCRSGSGSASLRATHRPSEPNTDPGRHQGRHLHQGWLHSELELHLFVSEVQDLAIQRSGMKPSKRDSHDMRHVKGCSSPKRASQKSSIPQKGDCTILASCG